jgi:chromosome partitioning protein
MEKFYIAKNNVADLVEKTPSTLYRKLVSLGLAGEKDAAGQYISLDIARKIISSYQKDFQIDKKVQAFFNFKGGTGKTTLVYNVSYFLYLLGFKVLVIDCDPQSHLTRVISGTMFPGDKTINEVLTADLPIREAIYEIHENFHLIPSSIKLSFFESSQVTQGIYRGGIVSERLNTLKDEYDFIFIDVNPSINLLNRNVIMASDRVNIVTEAQPFSFFGMETLLQEFKQLSKQPGGIKVDYKIILNKVETRATINIEIANALQAHEELQFQLFDSMVRKSEDFNVSARTSTPVIFLKGKKSSNAREDITQLSKDLLASSVTLSQSLKENSNAA